MGKEYVENLTLTVHVEGKRDRKNKHRINYLMSFCKWLTGKRHGGIAERQTLFRATQDKMLWRAIISHVMKGHGTQNNNKTFLFLLLCQVCRVQNFQNYLDGRLFKNTTRQQDTIKAVEAWGKRAITYRRPLSDIYLRGLNSEWLLVTVNIDRGQLLTGEVEDSNMWQSTNQITK